MPLYARYGLRDNPFYYELNPLERAEDARLYARVAGFQRIMDSIDQRLAERVLRKRPAFLLLSGGSGSGRTALARYALAKYRELRAIESCRFMVPLVQLDHSMKTGFSAWMIKLGNQVAIAEGIDIGNLAGQFGAKSIGEVVGDDLLRAHFAGLTAQMARALAAGREPAGFGVLLRALPTAQLFRDALEIFEHAATLVVGTAVESVAIELKTDDGVLAHVLPPLTGPEIPLVVGKRWNDSVQRGEPCPFDDIGLSSAFTQSHPIERVLKLVGQLLDSRLSAFPNGQDWPTDQSLFCDQNYIIEQVGVLSRFLEHRP